MGVRLVTHDGMPFTPQLPAEPVIPEDFDTDEGLLVRETLEPTVLLDGRIVARGGLCSERTVEMHIGIDLGTSNRGVAQ